MFICPPQWYCIAIIGLEPSKFGSMNSADQRLGWMPTCQISWLRCWQFMQSAIPNTCHVWIHRQTNFRFRNADPRRQTWEMMTASSLPICLCGWLWHWLTSSECNYLCSFRSHHPILLNQKGSSHMCIKSFCIFVKANVFNAEQNINKKFRRFSDTQFPWHVSGRKRGKHTKTFVYRTAFGTYDIK